MFEVNKFLTNAKTDDILDICYIYTYLQFYLDEYVMQKLVDIGKVNSVKEAEKEKSIFDDYDEENGYTEDEVEEENIYVKSIYTINCLIKYAIRELKMDYRDCIKCNLSEMLDYILYNLKYERDNKESNATFDDNWEKEI